MKRSLYLFSLVAGSAMLLNTTNNAYAYNFTDKIYGKASVRIGYNFKHHVGSYMNTYLKGYEQSMKPTSKMIAHTRSTQHYVTVSAGYNFYYKLNDMFHPFIGYEATGMLPIGSRTFARQYPYRTGVYINTRMLNKIQEYFIFHQRSGVKINLIRNFAIIPYATLGFNVLKSDRLDDKKRTDVGLTIGCGIETMFLDKFSFALEYRFSRNRSASNSTSVSYGFIESNNAMAKFGYYFL